MQQLCSAFIFLQLTVFILGSAIDNSTVTTIATPTNITATVSEKNGPKPALDCFHMPECNESKCVVVGDGAVLCCNLSAFVFKEMMSVLQTHRNLTKLHVRNTSLGELSMNLFWLSDLESLAFTDGRVDRITRQNITNLSNLKCLNLSNNNLSEMDSRIVKDLPNLRQLDLSNNNITNLTFLLPERNSNDDKNNVSDFWLNISNNTNLWCSNIKDLSSGVDSEKWKLHFLNYKNTFCAVSRNYWFSFVFTIPYEQVENLEKVVKNCSESTPCTCKLTRIRNLDAEEAPSVAISVNCAGKNLTQLPEIPEHTVELNVSDNNITSLKKIRTDKNYNDLEILEADNNQITSIQDIEGTQFLNRFRMLNIRSNKLTEIQTYILDHAFDGSIHKQVQLAGNKVLCDCKAAQHLKLWLLKNRKLIEDYDEIRCNNFNYKVIDLDQNKVCKYPHVWTDYIHYIIAGEVVLLLLLVSKVSYDYWVFRTAGYLPWPASKMPKMPCDWVFET